MSTKHAVTYHVIRPCPPHLETPVVFFSLQEAKNFVEIFLEEDDDDDDDDDEKQNSIIQTFDSGQECIQYAEQLLKKGERKKKNNNNQKIHDEDPAVTDVKEICEATKASLPTDPSSTIGTETVQGDEKDDTSEAVASKDAMKQVTESEKTNSAVTSPNASSKNVESAEEENVEGSDSAAVTKGTSPRTKRSASASSSSTPRKRKATSAETGRNSTKKKKTEETTPTKRKIGRPRKIRDSLAPAEPKKSKTKERWFNKLKLLHEYREKYGTAIVEDENCVGKFLNLNHFFRRLKLNMRCYKGLIDTKGAATFDEDMFNYAIGLGLESVLEEPIRQQKNPRATQRTWEEMYQELEEFYEEHGHVKVPQQPRTVLANWVCLQRYYFKEMKKGKKTPLTPERIGLLQKFGFRFEQHPRYPFDARAAEWLEYRLKHGKDPTMDSGVLGKWITKVRRRYRYFMEGRKDCSITQEQIDKLTNWGFKWESGWKREGRAQTKSKKWDERYQELVEFYNEHGHTKVKQQGPLGHWVHRQRKEYTKMKTGRKHFLTKEKLEKLKAINFVFLTRKRPTRRNSDGKVVPIAAVKNPYDLEADEDDNMDYNYDADDNNNKNENKKKTSGINTNSDKKQNTADDSDSSSSSDEEYDEEEEGNNKYNSDGNTNYQYQQEQNPYHMPPLTVAATAVTTTTQESPMRRLQGANAAPWDHYRLPRQSLEF